MVITLEDIESSSGVDSWYVEQSNPPIYNGIIGDLYIRFIPPKYIKMISNSTILYDGEIKDRNELKELFSRWNYLI